MSSMLQDIAHAWRVYRSTPVASLVALLVLAVALAFLAAFLSLFVHLLPGEHRGFDTPGELVSPVVRMPEYANPVTLAVVEQLERRVSGLRAVAGAWPRTVERVDGAEVEPLNAELVTQSFFAGLEPKMAMGRGIAPDQHHADGLPEVVISHELWRERFGGDPGLLGREIELQAVPFAAAEDDERVSLGRHRVVGVAHARMDGLFPNAADAWLAAERVLPFLMEGMPAAMSADSMNLFRMFGRRVGDRSIASVERELVSRHDDGQLDRFRMPDDGCWRVYRGLTANPVEQRRLTRQVGLFLGVSVLVVVVAGANVGQFLLARAPGRRRELGIRMTVGAPRRRLRRQLLTEAAVLVSVALAIGALLSLWLVVLLQELAFLESSQWNDVSVLDGRMLAAVAVVAAATVALVSLAPIAGLKRIGALQATRRVSARASAFQRAGGTVQVAVAAIVSVIATAFGVHLWELGARDRGWDAAGVVEVSPIVRGVITASARPEAVESRRARYREALLTIPGVEAVAFGTPVPASRRMMTIAASITPPDRPDESITVRRTVADPGFAHLLDLRLLYGRWPGPGEEAGLIVNRALAEAVFGRTDVVGEVLPGADTPGGIASRPIAGVVDDVRFEHPGKPDEPRIYEPYGPLAGTEHILLATRLPLEELRAGITARIESGTLEFELGSIARLEDNLRRLTAPERARLQMSALAAIVVVVLALVGFFGTQRFLVDAGRREYAILAAIGAGPRALRRMVLGRGLWLAAPGLALAAPAAYIALAWLQQDFLPRDVPSLLIVAAVIAALAGLLALATLGPARRAASTAPAEQLRDE